MSGEWTKETLNHRRSVVRKLKRYMEREQLTVQDVTKLTGIDAQLINRHLRGQCLPGGRFGSHGSSGPGALTQYKELVGCARRAHKPQQPQDLAMKRLQGDQITVPVGTKVRLDFPNGGSFQLTAARRIIVDVE